MKFVADDGDDDGDGDSGDDGRDCCVCHKG